MYFVCGTGMNLWEHVVGGQTIHILIPRTCDYITLHGKRDFAGVIWDLEMGTLPWILPAGLL